MKLTEKKIKERIDINSARRRLARQLAKVLANPAIPANLHNAITDELTFYAELADYHAPRIIELSLLAYDENRETLEAEESKLIG